MKKYFLFIPLLVIVFLGLGNSNVFAQSCSATTTQRASEIWGSHYFSCEVNDYSKNLACGTTANDQRCYSPITGDSCTTYCCICMPDLTEMPSLSTQSIETTDTTPTILDERCEANEHNNAFGRCVCDDGFKKVDGECLDCNLESVCCGIELNTKVPFIGNCIEDKNYGGIGAEQAFPTLMGALTQILVTVILILSFVLILIGGIMIATGNASGGKKMIMKVVVGLALLGASGVILRLINPNFFG